MNTPSQHKTWKYYIGFVLGFMLGLQSRSCDKNISASAWSCLFKIGGAFGVGLFFLLILAGHKPTANPVPVSSVKYELPIPPLSVAEEEDRLKFFLSGLPYVEAAMKDWLDYYGKTTEGYIKMLQNQGYQGLSVSLEREFDCRIDDPEKEFPDCIGDMYKVYNVDCTHEGCGWTFCRHDENPYLCVYSMHGFVEFGTGSVERNCNILYPQARDFCHFLAQKYQFKANE